MCFFPEKKPIDLLGIRIIATKIQPNNRKHSERTRKTKHLRRKKNTKQSNQSFSIFHFFFLNVSCSNGHSSAQDFRNSCEKEKGKQKKNQKYKKILITSRKNVFPKEIMCTFKRTLSRLDTLLLLFFRSGTIPIAIYNVSFQNYNRKLRWYTSHREMLYLNFIWIVLSSVSQQFVVHRSKVHRNDLLSN